MVFVLHIFEMEFSRADKRVYYTFKKVESEICAIDWRRWEQRNNKVFFLSGQKSDKEFVSFLFEKVKMAKNVTLKVNQYILR